jgi:hypothetical protein
MVKEEEDRRKKKGDTRKARKRQNSGEKFKTEA